MRGRGPKRASIEIEVATGVRGVVVVRLTGVIDAAVVVRLRDALSCLVNRPIVIDLDGCTLASRDFGHLLAELHDRDVPCFVACPRIGARLLLGLRGDEPLDWVHGSVVDALSAMAAAAPAQPGADQPYVEPSAPAPYEPAYT